MKRHSIFFAATVALLSFSMVGCRDHIIKEEVLPQPLVDFSYEVADSTYRLDFYAGCTILLLHYPQDVYGR